MLTRRSVAAGLATTPFIPLVTRASEVVKEPAPATVTMNCVRPNVSAEEEYNHRVRNMDFMQQREVEEWARLGDLSHLTQRQRGLAECYRDAFLT